MTLAFRRLLRTALLLAAGDQLGDARRSITSCRLTFLSYASPENLRSGHLKAQQGGCVTGAVARYDGQAADIWSCGVVLFVFMYGYTPWPTARESSVDFRLYKVASPSFPKIYLFDTRHRPTTASPTRSRGTACLRRSRHSSAGQRTL